LATRGLSVLTARSLSILTARGLGVLATRSLSILTAGTGQRPRGLHRLGLGHSRLLTQHLLRLRHLSRAVALGLGHRREASEEHHTHESSKYFLHLSPIPFDCVFGC
jgi:hypothetical protein